MREVARIKTINRAFTEKFSEYALIRCFATALRRKRRQPVKSNGLATVESKFCDGIAIGADPNFCSLPEPTPILLAVAIGFPACTTF